MSAREKTYSTSSPLLAAYPFKPNFIEIGGVRMHYILEGDDHAPAVLFLHGVPAWSYTFRNIIPFCLQYGLRVIAPDLPGFGKSDKPQNIASYSIGNLVNWIEGLIEKLDLKNLFLFAHDWGAIVGMIVAANKPAVFSGIILCNGYLPLTGQKTPFLFRFWRWFSRHSPHIPVGRVVELGCKRPLSRTERAGYNFPFSKERDKAAIRALPQLIPAGKNDPGAPLIAESWERLKKLEIPVLTVFSKGDVITRDGEKILQAFIPGTKNQPHRMLEGKHFLQEDSPNELALIIHAFVNQNK
ncbi:MAG: haloalkane dehalogenase [Bacteroides sp.]|nr:haloalkane dehalogenase [Bacteroides sp.]